MKQLTFVSFGASTDYYLAHIPSMYDPRCTYDKMTFRFMPYSHVLLEKRGEYQYTEICKCCGAWAAVNYKDIRSTTVQDQRPGGPSVYNTPVKGIVVLKKKPKKVDDARDRLTEVVLPCGETLYIITAINGA